MYTKPGTKHSLTARIELVLTTAFSFQLFLRLEAGIGRELGELIALKFTQDYYFKL